MKNLLSFDEFVNEHYDDNSVYEGRNYYVQANNKKLADQYKKKIIDILKDIAVGASKMSHIEYANDLTEIFGPEAKTWWTQGNPNWSRPNPTFWNSDKSPKNFSIDNSVKVEFIGYNEENPAFSLAGGPHTLEAFVKTKDVPKVFAEWKALLASIAKKHGISNVVEVPSTKSGLGTSGDTPDTLSFLAWSDTRGGKRIEDKMPELGYSHLKMNFVLDLVPTPEESETFLK
jgi:hypothetical protein